MLQIAELLGLDDDQIFLPPLSSPDEILHVGQEHEGKHRHRHEIAINNFWRLRNTENGLAIESYPSIVGVCSSELGLTSEPPRE